jgi:hypothetical protein
MHGDPAAHTDPDRSDLAVLDPNSGFAIAELGLDTKASH